MIHMAYGGINRACHWVQGLLRSLKHRRLKMRHIDRPKTKISIILGRFLQWKTVASLFFVANQKSSLKFQAENLS